MASQQTPGGAVRDPIPAYNDRPVDNGVVSRNYANERHIGVGENDLNVRDRVQWGPIFGGVLTSFVVLALLTILGLAIGTAAFEPTADGEELGAAAGIWGAISAIIAFFVGGWFAAKTAAVDGPGTGMVNGFLVAATTIALLLFLSSTGLANLFGTLGLDLTEIAGVSEVGGTVAAEDAEADLRQNFDEVSSGAWGTLGGLALALGASALGGFVGHNKREELISGTSAGR